MSTTGWHLDRIEHTFSTGRKAVLRPSPNLIGAFTDVTPEDVESGKVTPAMVAVDRMHAILQAMFVHPRITDYGEPTVDESLISWEELRPEEIAETVDVWREAAAQAATFRSKPARTRSRANGTGVGRPAKRVAGAAGGAGGQPAG